MAVMVPDRTHAARMDALARANEIRFYRSRLKRHLDLTLAADVLRDPPAETLTMKVIDLLRSIPNHGPAKARRILDMARISHGKTIGGLTPRQRGELLEKLT